MICMNFKDVEPIQVKKINYQGTDFEVKGASIRWLTHKNLGGDEYQHNHALRHFTIAPGGEVPIHQHKYTQIMYILSGKALTVALSEANNLEDGSSWGTFNVERGDARGWFDSPVSWYLQGDVLLLAFDKSVRPPVSRLPIQDKALIVGGIPPEDPRPFLRFEAVNRIELAKEYFVEKHGP